MIIVYFSQVLNVMMLFWGYGYSVDSDFTLKDSFLFFERYLLTQTWSWIGSDPKNSYLRRSKDQWTYFYIHTEKKE